MPAKGSEKSALLMENGRTSGEAGRTKDLFSFDSKTVTLDPHGSLDRSRIECRVISDMQRNGQPQSSKSALWHAMTVPSIARGGDVSPAHFGSAA